MNDTTKNARDVLLELVEACEAQFCCPQTEAMEPDDSKASYPEDLCHITFGMIRRARAALSEKEQRASAVPEGYVLVQRRDAEAVARFASNHAGRGIRNDATLAGMRILDQIRLAAKGPQS